MEKMQIRLVSIVEENRHILARLRATAPEIGARIWVEIRFRAPEGSRQRD